MNARTQDPKALWATIEAGVTRMVERLEDGLSPTEYMEFYTAVYNYCTVQSNPPSYGVGGSAGTSQTNMAGVELYKQLKVYLDRRLNAVLKEMDGLMQESLLEVYVEQWEKFARSVKCVNGAFTYLNRHWVKREKEEGNPVHEVHTLCFVTWRDIVFQTLQTKLTSAMLELIRRERNGDTINNSLLKGTVSCYVALGIADGPEKSSNLGIYEHAFQKDFLESTELYYKAESDSFISNNSVSEYMKKVERRLEEEEHRVLASLHDTTREPLMERLDQVLIIKHFDVIKAEFGKLLALEKNEDLARMYKLLARTKEKLDEVKNVLEEHVCNTGMQAIERVAQGAAEDPKMYVDTLLEIHTKYDRLVQVAFAKDSKFVSALDKACRKFVNENAVTKHFKTAQKSPELVARYCDMLLKKSAKNPEENELEELLNKILVVFKYIEDKDVFQKYYSKMLAKRLVGATSVSDDMEASMISKLKITCGYEYVSKLQRMVQDIDVSKSLNERFQQHLASSNLDRKGMDFEIKVLSTASWPLNSPVTPFNLPTELEKWVERFKLFYATQHNGRKLTWLYHNSKGEVTTTYLKAKYTIQASTYQMGILLLYNNQKEYTWSELQTHTGLNDSHVDGIMEIMVKAKILLSDCDSEASFTPATKFTLNEGYKNKRLKVNINAPIKSEIKQEQEEAKTNIDEDRKIVIQAAVVRIMKMRKNLNHTTLITEVIEQLQGRFSPKVPLIKKCIDILIEKEYLARQEGQKDMYVYMA
eukprot:comp18734_c0_seq1/m.20531 comp18734_c0_seq1/g.20531  ORF comp18734_c0_seq1/g.20531 comp18734_c0_seq1/m.20531 type:complete len:758 (-) comp18734_c0_seq1:460-2733(-)